MRCLGGVCAIAILVACSSSTGVRPFGGAYELVNVDGQPDPQPLAPGTTTPDLVGGTLVVGPDSLTLTLSLQEVDSVGRPTGSVQQLAGTNPYVRQGDSLFAVSDSSGLGNELVPTTGATPIGVVVGSNVVLTLDVAIPTSTGFGLKPRRFFFAPAL